MPQERLSIITINYNNREGLQKTIESVVNQTYRSFEYIIIDGGSTDGSVEVIKEYEDNISYWVSEPDNGIYHAMNKGIAKANAPYCQFLNSGDNFHSTTVLEQVIPCLDGTDIVVGQLFLSNTLSASEIIPTVSMLRLYERSLPHSSAYISTRLLRKYQYDTSLKIVSDWKFYIQALIYENASYKFIETIVSNFDTNGISSQNTALVLSEREQVLKELLPERIRLDYFKFANGQGYQENSYDQFFIQTRKYPQYAKLVYSISVIMMQLISVFKRGAQYARNFPIRFNHKNIQR